MNFWMIHENVNSKSNSMGKHVSEHEGELTNYSK